MSERVVDADGGQPSTTDASSVVTLGEASFDPVAIQDFRLSIEGTSGTGKSNTLAVVLEDLANVPLPTLVIERLGALTPVRLEDDNILVVGARDEAGIDVPVALEDLDKVGEWVLDRGLKILVDISTYADYEEDKSRIHLAAAQAIRSLNDRAHERYRAGERTKSLLVVDEAHILAPKDSAPEPELDDWVKRCRGQLIKAATEGGNKGISIVVAYQRRAFLHNGVIQLAQDFIAHRPGDEDIGRTANALRCSEETLAGLATGEILARGASITDGHLVGPTTVRKRSSPDPREEQFELPEVSADLADVLEEMQSEVDAERRQRDQRQDELERLRAENDRLQTRVEDLEQELADTDRLASALENLGSNGGGAAQDVGEGVVELRRRVEELKAERDELEAHIETLESEKSTLEAEHAEANDEIASLEAEIQEARSTFEAVRTHVGELVEALDVDIDVGVDLDATDSASRSTVQPDVDVGETDFEGVRSHLLAEFQEDAVDRILDNIGEMSPDQRRLLKYIESRGRTLDSQKRWAQAALGLDSKPNSTHYTAMGELLERNYARKNKDGSIAPNVRGKIEGYLSKYDAAEDVVQETYEAVLTRLASGGGDRDVEY